jgi:hypothetical protein
MLAISNQSLSRCNEDMCLKNDRFILRKSHSRSNITTTKDPPPDCSIGLKSKTLCAMSEHATTSTTKKVSSPRMCFNNFVSLSQRSLLPLSKISLLSQSQKSLRFNDNDSFASETTVDLSEDFAEGPSSAEDTSASKSTIVVEWGNQEEKQRSQKKMASRTSLQNELNVLLDGIDESISPHDSGFWSSSVLEWTESPVQEWTESASSLDDSVFGLTRPSIKRASIWNSSAGADGMGNFREAHPPP